jgi:hypothetical protein
MKLDDCRLLSHQHYFGYAHGSDVQHSRTAMMLNYATLMHLNLLPPKASSFTTEEHERSGMNNNNNSSKTKRATATASLSFLDYMDHTVTPFGMMHVTLLLFVI